jgi:hypothetical protein
MSSLSDWIWMRKRGGWFAPVSLDAWRYGATCTCRAHPAELRFTQHFPLSLSARLLTMIAIVAMSSQLKGDIFTHAQV